MILNNELIRNILLYVEENGNDKLPTYDIKIDGYTQDEIKYHFKRMLEANLINGSSLTWQGHKYLESIKDKYIWEKVKRDIELKGITSVTIEILKDYADRLIRKQLDI